MGRTQRPAGGQSEVRAGLPRHAPRRSAFGDGFSVIEQGRRRHTRRAPAQSVSKVGWLVGAGRLGCAVMVTPSYPRFCRRFVIQRF